MFSMHLETNRDHSVIFEIASKYCILDSSVDYEGYSIFLRDSCHSRSSELNLPFQSPMMKRTFLLLLLLLILEDLVSLHRTGQLLRHQWLAHRLGLLWWLNGLPWKQTEIHCFWDCTQVLHFGLFCWLWGLLHFFYGILAHSSRYNGHLN